MFNLFGKTKKKAEEAIEKGEETLSKADVALENINVVALEMKQVMTGIKTLIALSTIGIVLGIMTDMLSIFVSGQTAKIIKK